MRLCSCPNGGLANSGQGQALPLLSERRDQPGEQRAASGNVVHNNMLMRRVRTVAVYSQPIKHSGAHCGGEVSIRRTANLRFAKFEV
jgi:hypothetical protein